MVKIRNITLGEGRPKICVPLTGRTKEELSTEAARAIAAACDLVEWRADCFDGLFVSDRLTEMLRILRGALGDMPLLFTIRTDREGGTIAISSEDYLSCNLTAIESGLVDMVDAELSRGDAIFSAIVRAAKERAGSIRSTVSDECTDTRRSTDSGECADTRRSSGSDECADARRSSNSDAPATPVAVVGSRHDFEKTPPREVIVESLCRMQRLGADIAKYAVMPRSERDVLTLLDATLTMKEEHSTTPVITMSMGKQGVASRVAGGVFGSCLTFGPAGKASAPGQIPAEDLREFLKYL